jgi:hypothetical protein
MKQEVKPGDQIILYHMEGETMLVGEKGVVQSISRDPFEPDNEIIGVKWEDGSTLNLLSKYDFFKVLKDKNINESEQDSPSKPDFNKDNRSFFKNFDIKSIEEFLADLKNSGITKMLGASPYLYLGDKAILAKHGIPSKNRKMTPEQKEAYKKVLANANTIKNKIMSGVYKNMQEMNGDFDISDLDREIKKQSIRLLNNYALFS